jgi:hypothetical protein
MSKLNTPTPPFKRSGSTITPRTAGDTLNMGLALINNVGDPVDSHDAVNLHTLNEAMNVGLNFWLGNTTLSPALTDSEAALTETAAASPATLTSILFKSTVALTPTPFTIDAGGTIEIHFNGKVTATSGKHPTTLKCQFGYVDADGTSNFVQIGADSSSTATLTATKTLYELHCHVTTETTIPAGKRLWLKYIATATVGGGVYPEINVYYNATLDHVSFGVQATILGNYVPKSLYDAYSVLYADTDNTPAALTVGNNTVVGRVAAGIVAIDIDGDLSAVSAADDTVPSAKATKAYADGKVADAINDGTTTIAPSQNAVFDALALKSPLASPTFTGKITKGGVDEVGKSYTPATGAQTVTIDCAANNMHIVTGHANGTAITFAIQNATNSQPFIISVLQGSGTVSTIAAWFATVRWPAATVPTFTATLNKRDTFGFIRTAANQYDGFIIGQAC